jgi:topoisomerase-4 subunit A
MAEETTENIGSIRSIQHLDGMYQKWFLDYASYVILERAVPYVNDD